MTLRLDGVGVELGGRTILHEVDLTVHPGELLALVGPNGAGKSTLLSVLSGDLAPSHGSATLDDQPLGSWRVGELARRRAVLSQEQRLAFGFRVVDVVRMGRAPWAARPEEDHDDDAVAAAMARTEVLDMAARVFPTLSGGEKARTSLARVLAQDTALVLLDEPTAALDIRHSELVLGAARRLADLGHAVVVVLHDLSIAAAHADRLCVVDGGTLRASGPPAEVLDPTLLHEVYGHPVDVIEHDGHPVVIPRRRHASATPTQEDVPCAPAL